MARNVTTATPRSVMAADGEELANLCSPVALLPEQFFASPLEAEKGQGERALMWAVLAGAVFCVQTYRDAPRRSQRRLAQEVEAWLGAEDHHWPFSFCNICQALGLDPDYIRLGLKRWQQLDHPRRQRHRRRAAPAQRPLPLAA